MERAKETLTALYLESFSNLKEFMRTLEGREEERIRSVSPHFHYQESSGCKEAFAMAGKGNEGNIEKRFEERLKEARQAMKAKEGEEKEEKADGSFAIKRKAAHQAQIKKGEFMILLDQRGISGPSKETEEAMLSQPSCIALLERDYGLRSGVSVFSFLSEGDRS